MIENFYQTFKKDLQTILLKLFEKYQEKWHFHTSVNPILLHYQSQERIKQNKTNHRSTWWPSIQRSSVRCFQTIHSTNKIDNLPLSVGFILETLEQFKIFKSTKSSNNQNIMVLEQKQLHCRTIEPNKRVEQELMKLQTLWYLIKMSKTYTGEKSTSPTSGVENTRCPHLVE